MGAVRRNHIMALVTTENTKLQAEHFNPGVETPYEAKRRELLEAAKSEFNSAAMGGG